MTATVIHKLFLFNTLVDGVVILLIFIVIGVVMNVLNWFASALAVVIDGDDDLHIYNIAVLTIVRCYILFCKRFINAWRQESETGMRELP